MSFQLQKPEHDLHTCAFHIARQTNIRRFVKSGFQLNQRRDRFAQFGSLDQRLDDRLSSVVRYNVCLIATTSGSCAAWRMNCTTTSKLS